MEKMDVGGSCCSGDYCSAVPDFSLGAGLASIGSGVRVGVCDGVRVSFIDYR